MLKAAQYIQEVKKELAKVSWPTQKQTKQKTLVVVIASLIIGLYIGLSDFLFQEAMKLVIK